MTDSDWMDYEMEIEAENDAARDSRKRGRESPNLEEFNEEVAPGFSEAQENEVFGADDDGGSANEQQEMPELQEPTNQTETATHTIPLWCLGIGIQSVPPSDNRSAVHSIWSEFDDETSIRPLIHMACNFPTDFVSTNGKLGVFKTFDRPEINRRSASFAAIFGHLDYKSKGIFIDNFNLLEQATLPEDEKKRKDAINAMKPLKSYMFTHRFRAYADQQTKEILSDEQFPINAALPNTSNFSYTAPCEINLVETLYSKRVLERGSENADDRGAAVGYRLHTIVLNKDFSPAKLASKIMQESHEMHVSGRATRCSNSKRNVGSERAAKQQRLMVASEDTERFSSMKFAQLHENFSYIQNLQSVAGVGSGGSVRSFYTDMQGALGNGSLHGDIANHKNTKYENEQHALAPECVFNFRDGARPPKNLFPPDKFPEYYTQPEGAEVEGRVAVAGMVGIDGVEISIHPKQKNPENYFDENGFLKFPFSDSVYMLTNYQMPLRDCTLPNHITSGPKPGNCMLEAFWDVHRESDAVVAAEKDILRDIARRSIVARNLRKNEHNDYDDDDDDDEQEFVSSNDELEITNEMARLRENGRPNFGDMKIRLDSIFCEVMSPSGDSIMNKRLNHTLMVLADSLDSTPADSGPRPSSGESNVREVKIATETTARTVNRALNMVEKSVAMRQKRGEPDVEAFNYKSTQEALVWGIRCFVETYEDHKNAESVYPVAREIWRTTPKLIQKIPELGGYAVVDKKNPNRRNGSANIAFCFNNYMAMEGLSSYGNYKALLAKIYGPGIAGIQGRTNAIRNALHDGLIAPAGPKGFREMIAINGVKAMAKSLITSRFKYIFNRTDDPDITRNWLQSEGGGSARATQAGGIVGGGATVADEAIRAVASGGQNDPGATEQMQDLKQLATDGQTSRPRCEQQVGADGKIEYKRIVHVMKDNTTRIMCLTKSFLPSSPPPHLPSYIYSHRCHNLGANICHKGKGPPIVPEMDREALIDRVVSVLAVDGAQTDVIGEDVFQSNVEQHPLEMTAHTLVVSLTYMCLEMCSLVSRWRPSRETEAMRFWAMLDEFMLTEYDIPKPDARRQTLRRNNALQKAIEHAVVRVFLYKDEATAFADMLPVSEPFDQSADPAECVHVLAPYDDSHLANVFNVATYDPEIVLDSWSCGLDRNMYTIPDVHEILVKFGKLHGVENMSNNKLASQWLVDSDATGEPKRAEQRQSDLPQQPGAGDDVDEDVEEVEKDAAEDSFSFGVSDGAGYGMAFNPGLPAEDVVDAVQSAAVEVQSNNSHDLSAHISNIQRHENASGEQTIRGQMQFVRLRRRISTLYSQRCKNLDMWRVKRHPSVADTVKAAFGLPETAGDSYKFTLPTGEELTLKFVCDLLLPTVNEVGDCGYNFKDINMWLNGRESETPFGKEDAEGIYLGVPLSHRKWSFQRRTDVSQFTEYVYDCSWRTMRTSSTTLTSSTEADDGASGGAPVGAPGADGGGASLMVARGGAGGASHTRSWESSLWIDTTAVAKSITSFEINRLQVFDRIAQIINSTKEKFRLVPISPESREDLEHVSEIAGVGQTSMRLFDENVEIDKVRGKDLEVTKKLFNALHDIKAEKRQVIPLRAVGWRDTVGRKDHHNKASNSKRDASFVHLGIEVSDLAQCRLDKLVEQRSLPAANPLTSSVVVMAPPIKQEKEIVYINTGFFISLARFSAEVDVFLSTVPGIRTQSKILATEKYNEGSMALGAVDAPVVEKSSIQEDANVSAAVQHTARQIHNEGRTDVTDNDIHQCISQMLFKKTAKTDLVFDKISIYYTFQAHDYVSWNDPELFGYLCSKFPSVFLNRTCLQNIVPETVTRFFDLKNNTRSDIAHGAAFTPSFLSSQKRFEPTQSSKSTGKGIKKASFTPDELASVQRSHFSREGVWVTDIKELKKIATMLSCSPDPGSVELCNRSKWRDSTVKAKITSGMISKDGDLKMAIADTGMNLLRHVKIHFAKNPLISSGVTCIDKAAKYMRPYKLKSIKGTCSDTERSTTSLAIKMALENLTAEGGNDTETCFSNEATCDSNLGFD